MVIACVCVKGGATQVWPAEESSDYPRAFLHAQYSNIKANSISFNKKTIVIGVDQSASPLFYKMSRIKKYKRLILRGSVIIKKFISAGKDDAYLQVGVLYDGKHRPSSLKLMFAPDWIKKLFEFLGERGLGQLVFYDVSEEGVERTAKKDLSGIPFVFKTVAHFKPSEEFQVVFDLDERWPISGLWIRADGDDSSASFTSQIFELRLEPLTTPAS